MEVQRMKKKKFIRFLQNILLVIELTFYVAYLHIEKVLFFQVSLLKPVRLLLLPDMSER